MEQQQQLKQQLSKAWLILSNFIVSAAWARVFFVLISNRETLFIFGGDQADTTISSSTGTEVCEEILILATHTALFLSCVELLNALVGLTRSKPMQVFIFNSVRIGVAFVVAPQLSLCYCWQTLLTIGCWSFGDTIRFGCFGIDTAFPSQRMAKNIRYTVAPFIFPFGAMGEMLMVIRIGTIPAYLFSALWPIGFYPLWMQLLRQRQKHFATKEEKKKVIKSVYWG